MDVRSQFPALTQKINGHKLVYLDSAATSLKPWKVIERLSHFYAYETANVHRGAHYLAQQATVHFEAARKNVAEFIGANEGEVVFTKGTTDSINLVAYTLSQSELKEGDEILVSEMEHHSNLVPWQIAAERSGAKVKFIGVNPDGDLDFDDFAQKLSGKTKLVAITHVSNSLGTINDVQRICTMAKAVGAKVLVDGAQAVSCMPVNVKKIGADFYTFSGHKIYGPYGIGILYGRSEILSHLPPFETGGSMVDSVKFEGTTFLGSPFRFEAGTPNISGAIGLGMAVDFIRSLGFEYIQQHNAELVTKSIQLLHEIPKVKLVSHPVHRGPIISFVVEGCHASDVGQILDEQGVALRAGHHCTQPILNKLGHGSTVRASFGAYNTIKDIESLASGLLKAIEILL